MTQTEDRLKQLTRKITADDTLHAKWLNTLSMMENSGARKISRFEHPTRTGIMVLKHAAEESRHAYYLKKQIAKLRIDLPDYSFPFILAPMQSYHYLSQLDLRVSRHLTDRNIVKGRNVLDGAYILVTYAIEVRADMLYGIYQENLTGQGSKINVKSIIAEEEGHLEEMTRMLEHYDPDWKTLAMAALNSEEELFLQWIAALEKEVGSYMNS